MVLGLLHQNYSVDTVTSVRAFFLLLPSELRPFSLGYGSHRRATTHVACGSLERCKQRPSRPRGGSSIGYLLFTASLTDAAKAPRSATWIRSKPSHSASRASSPARASATSARSTPGSSCADNTCNLPNFPSAFRSTRATS